MQLILAVGDVGRSVEFYERVFGWPRNDQRAAWFADPDGNVVAVEQATLA